AIYEALGWKRSRGDAAGVFFFQCVGLAFLLSPRTALATDAGVAAEGSGCTGIALAYNTRRWDADDEIPMDLRGLRAEPDSQAAETFWGGYDGYFRDLDGHLWEVAWNPGFEITADGAIILPDG